MHVFLVLLQAALAAITSPAPGERVSGVVTITGTAAHPQFVRYEVAFAYDPNPTATWFEISTSTQQVADGVLSTWDTRSIADGPYMIRLRVYSSDAAAPLEAVVQRVTVQNAAPTAEPPTATAAPPATPQPAAPTETARPAASPTVGAAGIAPQPTRRPPLLAGTAEIDYSPYTSAFCSGAWGAAGFFLLLGLYVALRDRIRRPIRRWLRRVVSDLRKP